MALKIDLAEDLSGDGAGPTPKIVEWSTLAKTTSSIFEQNLFVPFLAVWHKIYAAAAGTVTLSHAPEIYDPNFVVPPDRPVNATTIVVFAGPQDATEASDPVVFPRVAQFSGGGSEPLARGSFQAQAHTWYYIASGVAEKATTRQALYIDFPTLTPRQLSFTAAPDGGAPITHYEVDFTRASDGHRYATRRLTPAPAAGGAITLSTPVPSRPETLRIRIRAHNVYGPSQHPAVALLSPQGVLTPEGGAGVAWLDTAEDITGVIASERVTWNANSAVRTSRTPREVELNEPLPLIWAKYFLAEDTTFTVGITADAADVRQSVRIYGPHPEAPPGGARTYVDADLGTSVMYRYADVDPWTYHPDGTESNTPRTSSALNFAGQTWVYLAYSSATPTTADITIGPEPAPTV